MTDDLRIAALDIGGTRIKAGLFEGMKLVQTAETDTPAKEGAKALLKAAGDLLDSFQPFEAVGISTAGQVDPITGIMTSVWSINLCHELLPPGIIKIS